MEITAQIGWPLLSLVGGYFFVSSSNLTRFWCSQYDGHKLYFCAVGAGVLFIAITRLCINLVQSLPDQLILQWGHAWLVTAVAFLAAGLFGHGVDRLDELLKRGNHYIPIALCGASLLILGFSYIAHVVIEYLFFLPWLTLSIMALAALFQILMGTAFSHGWFVAHFRFGLFLIVIWLATAVALIDDSIFRQAWAILAVPPQAQLFAGSFLLAATAWWPINLLLPSEDMKSAMVRLGYDDSLESMFWTAFKEEETVQLNLQNGKVYIGYLVAMPPNLGAPDPYIRILPVASGYRDLATHTMKITTYYQQVYKSLVGESFGTRELQQLSKEFDKVIDCEFIVSASYFDPTVYDEFP